MHCPRCGCGYGSAVTAMIAVGDPRIPQEGDPIVCFNCAGINIYTVHPLLGLRQREATPEETFDLLRHPTVYNSVMIVRAAKGGG